MNLRKLTLASLLVGLGVIGSHIIYIPVGVSKVFPIQHVINLLSGIVLGPWYGVMIAFAISLLRNILGTGSLLAFPGSIIGAYLAGLVYIKTKKILLAGVGELFGTGILGALVSYPIAKHLLGKEATIFFYVGPFILSSLVGIIIGYFILKLMLKTDFIKILGVKL